MGHRELPLFGFPAEDRTRQEGTIVYSCSPTSYARIFVWEQSDGWGVGLYQHPTPDGGSLTSPQNRFHHRQEPIICADAFEVQLAIFHLIEKHLPPEVIKNAA
jgi:hypothetical protein